MNISDSTILIATSTQYKQYEFCIKGKSEVANGLKRLTYGKEHNKTVDKNAVVIKLVTKGKIVAIWNVRPRTSVIEVNGKKYWFDSTLLSTLHRKYPVNYYIEEKVFASQLQLENYYQALLKDKSFLYIVPHDFENEYYQKFNLTFKKDSMFSSPKAIADYLDAIIIKTIPKDRYSISYSPFPIASQNSVEEFIMTIYSKSELYERFNDPNAKKSGLTFYPTYIIRKR